MEDIKNDCSRRAKCSCIIHNKNIEHTDDIKYNKNYLQEIVPSPSTNIIN